MRKDVRVSSVLLCDLVDFVGNRATTRIMTITIRNDLLGLLVN